MTSSGFTRNLEITPAETPATPTAHRGGWDFCTSSSRSKSSSIISAIATSTRPTPPGQDLEAGDDEGGSRSSEQGLTRARTNSKHQTARSGRQTPKLRAPRRRRVSDRLSAAWGSNSPSRSRQVVAGCLPGSRKANSGSRVRFQSAMKSSVVPAVPGCRIKSERVNLCSAFPRSVPRGGGSAQVRTGK